VVIEVKAFRRGDWSRSIDGALKQIQKIQDTVNPRPDVMLVVVGEGLSPEERAERLRQISTHARDLNIAVEARVLDLDELRRKYGVA
jgi:hypothetical protein